MKIQKGAAAKADPFEGKPALAKSLKRSRVEFERGTGEEIVAKPVNLQSKRVRLNPVVETKQEPNLKANSESKEPKRKSRSQSVKRQPEPEIKLGQEVSVSNRSKRSRSRKAIDAVKYATSKIHDSRNEEFKKEEKIKNTIKQNAVKKVRSKSSQLVTQKTVKISEKKTRTKSAKQKNSVQDLDDTETEIQLSELVISASEFQSLGYTSPALSHRSKATIIYQDLQLKSWKSMRLSQLELNDSLTDEKEAHLSRQQMINTDSDYAEWQANWKKLRADTKKKFEQSKSVNWRSFKEFYLKTKPNFLQ